MQTGVEEKMEAHFSSVAVLGLEPFSGNGLSIRSGRGPWRVTRHPGLLSAGMSHVVSAMMATCVLAGAGTHLAARSRAGEVHGNGQCRVPELC